MIAVIQRVSEASVTIENKVKGEIQQGLVILLGIEEADNEEDIEWLNRKIINMRIFNDENGVMNKSLLEIEGEILLISQFTLHASTKKETDRHTLEQQNQILLFLFMKIC